MTEIIGYVRNLIPRGMEFILSAVIAVLVITIGSVLIKKLLKLLKTGMLKREMEPGVVSFLISASRVILYILLFIIAAQILGFATTSIVAIIGSAGLAVGLALQGSLANFAGGVLILLMKPFIVGDNIIVGDVEGVVQKIDIVYTTLSTQDNRDAILPNGKLADSNIINVTKEDKRRVDIEVGIEYSESIKRVREVLWGIAQRQEARLADMPVDIVVSALGESAVMMTVRIWVKPENYAQTRFAMLEEIKEEFDKNGIVIPYNKLDINVNPVANS